jgi:iron complex outermembrane recepter protein
MYATLKTSLLIGAALAALLAAPFAQAQQAVPATGASVKGEVEYAGEIIVTAQKRSQVLIEVPQSIAVVGGADLERTQSVSIADFQRLLPGLSSEQQNPGQSMLVLRGITTGSANPTVAVYVDDTPFGASTGQANAATLSGDFDTFDIDRIEVLRGPQGTLYGASSLGGVVRYITTAPKLDKLEGRVQAGIADVAHGGVDWSGNSVVNVPLGDNIAVRASGFYRSLGGFIDAPNLGRNNANKSKSYGGRASLLFKPTEALSVRLSALIQNIRTDSRSSYDADAVTLKPLSVDPVTGQSISGFNRDDFGIDKTDIDYRLYNATVDLDLGFANLTSVTSYGRLFQDDNTDQTLVPAGPGVSLGDAVTGLYGSAVPLGAYFSNKITMKKFTQEVRLASPDNDTLEWIVGAYYTREPGQLFQNYYPYILSPRAVLPVPVAGFNDLLLAQLDSKYKEYAGFGNVTWHISPRFDITGGARWSHNTQDTATVVDGALVGGRTAQLGHTSESVFTWTIAPRLELTDRVALYARVAKGFRPGGPNAPVPGLPDFSTTFRSDTLVSYEAGLRGETSDRTFAWDASLYYLDWKDIQIPVAILIPGVGPINVDGNGKGAKSYGLELSTTLRPTRGLRVTTNFSYNKNKLKGSLADGSGLNGERLPISPKYSANFDVDYEWEVTSSVQAFVGGNVNLVSDRIASYDAAYRGTFGHNVVMDGYATLDLRAGVDFNRFNVSVYAKNVTNSDAISNVLPYGDRPDGVISVYPIRPRTIGVTVGASY